MNQNTDEQTHCPECNTVYDEDGDCECLPEDYVRPGNESFLYVNAYSVTRNYGGPEEGGWYYNAFEPIASIPVKAISHEGCGDHCVNCRYASEGKVNPETGTAYKFCKSSFHLVGDEEKIALFTKHLQECFGYINNGNIYSVLGGEELKIVVEDHPGAYSPKEKPHYE